MKYRKKPIVIEAEQWFPNRDYIRGVFYDAVGPYVVTIHGQRTDIASGDWILPEPDGEHFYPCKADIFTATYELVEEAP